MKRTRKRTIKIAQYQYKHRTPHETGKIDRSCNCGVAYHKQSFLDGSAHRYYKKYCSKCVHMCEVWCMYGETWD